MYDENLFTKAVEWLGKAWEDKPTAWWDWPRWTLVFLGALAFAAFAVLALIL